MEKKYPLPLYRPADLDALIERLKQETPQESTLDFIRGVLQNRLILTQTSQAGNTLTVYRVRIDEPGIKDTLVKEFIHPEKCKRGRANIKDFPVFYCSVDIHTALVEMKEKLKVGVKVFISKWEIKCEAPTHSHSFVITSKTTHKDSVLFDLTSSMLNKLTIPNIGIEEQGAFIYLVKKLGDLFSSAGDEYYHITSALAHESLYEAKKQGVNISMLEYPSVEKNGDSLNIAIHPDFVNSTQMKLSKIIYATVGKVDDEIYFEAEMMGFSEDNKKINWFLNEIELREIDYADLQILTYDKTSLEGAAAATAKIKNSPLTLQQHIDSDLRPALASQLHRIPSLRSVMESREEIDQATVYLELSHGTQLDIPGSDTCIHKIAVPVKWYRGFRKPRPASSL
ncbi:MAG: RES domain-containing protein [Flavobacteriales bacterium]